MGTRLTGKTVIISGGASGMGRAQARLFAREGASVCIVDINQKAGEEVADGIRRAGGQAICCRCDVRSAADWAAAVGSALDAFGQVTTLCNIAGSNVRNSFDEQTEEQWHFIVQTALTGAYLGIKAVVPAMRRCGHGSIINTGSLAVTHAGGNPAYSASKVGMLGLTVSTAAAYAADQIRCNLVSPGHVDTPFLRANTPHSPNDESTSINVPENYRRRLEVTPMGRLVQPEDIARAFLFLASDEASMITGAHLKVDGGAGLAV